MAPFAPIPGQIPARGAPSAAGWPRAALSLCLALLPLAAAGAAQVNADEQMQAIFSDLRSLREMAAGQEYTVRVGGKEETGPKEQFLRRRTAEEICASGLSCGCGDYVRAFIARVAPLGYDVLLVDAAEVSSASLQNHFSGHSVVAIRSRKPPQAAAWWLVDPTNFRLMTRNWSPTEKSFEAFDFLFWIGYCGSPADYPVRNAEQLKAFYARTLATVPREVLDANICRMEFTVDPSLVDKDGTLLNPRLSDFMRMQPRVLEAYGVTPLRRVAIRLVRGGNDSSGELRYSRENGWVCRVGLESACSPSLLSYLEQTIHRKWGPVFY